GTGCVHGQVCSGSSTLPGGRAAHRERLLKQYGQSETVMLELYNAPQSTCSQKVRLTLAEKGLEFVEHKLRLFQNDQLKPEYLKLNPNGVVPTLVDGGVPIIDSSVSMQYIDEQYAAVS